MPQPSTAKSPAIGEVPHSWPVAKWPAAVFPNNTPDARNLVRFFRKELVAAKALTRIGKKLVVMGDKYDSWLRSRSSEVESFQSPFDKNRASAS